MSSANGNGHRQMWDEVLPRWRASQQAVSELGAEHATRSVHGTLMYLLAGHQRTEDRVYLGRIADLAGVAEDRITPRLRYLHDIGAIIYTPGRGRRPGTVALPPAPAPSAVVDAEGNTRAQRGNTDPELPRSRPRTTALSAANTPLERGDTEDLSEDPSEGSSVTSRDAGAHADAGAREGATAEPTYQDRYRELFDSYLPTGRQPTGDDFARIDAIGQAHWPELFPPNGNRHGILDDIFDAYTHHRPRDLDGLDRLIDDAIANYR